MMILEFKSSPIYSFLVSLNRGVFSALTLTSEEKAWMSDWIKVVFATTRKLKILMQNGLPHTSLQFVFEVMPNY